MDTRSISSTHQRDRSRARKLLGSAVQYSLALNCGEFASEELQRPTLPGGFWRVRFYYCACAHANNVNGSTELLSTIYDTDERT